MNTTQEQLLSLLTLAIHGGVPNNESFSSIDGKELFNLALQQNVSSLLYPILNKYREDMKFDEQVLHRWKETTLFRATRQMIMMNGIKIIFDLFKSNGIPVISLKGLALKQVYPQPELRNMGDIDLFLNEKDIPKAIELLSTQGYHPNSEDLNDPEYMHIVMLKPGSFSVELHRTLWHPRRMKKRNNQLWVNHIWDNKRQLELEGINFSALSPEDELINLVIHLARHLMHSAENLQQLCDIVLFIKTYWDIMDLEYIEQTLKSMDFFIFYQFLLSTCHFFFELDIPTIPIYSDIHKSEILLNDILSPKMHSQVSDEAESCRPLLDRYIFARNNQFLIPLAFVLEVGRQFVKITKSILHCIPLTKKPIRFLKNFNKRSRYLRRIGVHLKY